MKALKRLVVCMVVLAMVFAAAACSAPAEPSGESEAPADQEVSEASPAEVTSEEPAAEEGKVYNIYCWNTEFQDRFKLFFEEKGLVPDGIEVNWIITPSGEYQQKLDEALLGQADAADDDKVDLFLVEAGYALKYVNDGCSADVYSEVGLTEDDTADMYQYTKDICTDTAGALKAVSWQACPGGLIYRRSIAKDVIGSDDPEDVQTALDSWDKFDAVAAQAKEKGYYMTGSYVSTYRVFSNNVSAPWVNESDEVVFDPSIEAWIEQAKTYLDNGYTLPYDVWDTEHFNEAKVDGKAMCYFGGPWYFDFFLLPAALEDAEGEHEIGNGSYGDWGVVEGPQSFFWGGSWLCAATGSDNMGLTKDIMKTLTCDKDTLVEITKQCNEFTNNANAMNEIANSDFANPFLSGQNHIAVFLKNAENVDMSNMTMYDQLINEPLPALFEDYFLGTITLEEAYDNFYTAVLETYPNLKRPE